MADEHIPPTSDAPPAYCTEAPTDLPPAPGPADVALDDVVRMARHAAVDEVAAYEGTDARAVPTDLPASPEAPPLSDAPRHPAHPRLSPADDDMPPEMRKEFFPPLKFARLPGTEKPGGAAVDAVLKMTADELREKAARGEAPSGAFETIAAMREKLRSAGFDVDGPTRAPAAPTPKPIIVRVIRQRLANGLGIMGEAAETVARQAGPVSKVVLSLWAEVFYAGQELLDLRD